LLNVHPSHGARQGPLARRCVDVRRVEFVQLKEEKKEEKKEEEKEEKKRKKKGK